MVLAISLLIYGTCCLKNGEIEARNIVLYPLDQPAITMPLDVYMTDEFSPGQVEIYKKAAADWGKFTNGIVKINVISDYSPPEFFSESFYKNFSKHTVWSKTGQEEEVVKMFLKYAFTADAFTVSNVMVIINPFNNLDDNKLHIIFLHEIGHFLSLQHLDTKHGYHGLMEVDGNDGLFTKYDAIEFCFLYKCDYNKLR